MRDPEGTISFEGDSVARKIRADSPSLAFLKSETAASLAASGSLVAYEFAGSNEIRSPRYPFVSYPFEWSDAQLLTAAQLTLEVASQILPGSFELKDASAWNVIFAGGRPIFCDHLSFERIASKEWWAFGQYVRNFILPLALSRLKGVDARCAFLLNRDGLYPQTARSLIGARRFLSRYWPLMVGVSTGSFRPRRPPASVGKTYHEALYKYCTLNLPRRIKPKGSGWSSYRRERCHYSDAAIREKRNLTAAWLANLRPAWVVDLGCNTGEFSVLAAESGADTVVSIDFDHDSVQDLYVSQRSSRVIHPLVSDLADLSGGRGWAGDEMAGLVPRLEGRADVVICLALLHHLAVSESIPLTDIAHLLWKLTKAHAIVEFIDSTDPLLRGLVEQRNRAAIDFSIDRQKTSFAQYFDCEVSAPIPETAREIALLRKRSQPVARSN